MCIRCGKDFEPIFSQVICGPACSYFRDSKYAYVEINPKYYSAKRRAMMRRGDPIVPLIVFEMYDWTCLLCRGKIDPHRRMPDKLAATLEHAVPLSKDGGHFWDNVFPAHSQCNAAKADGVKVFSLIVDNQGLSLS